MTSFIFAYVRVTNLNDIKNCLERRANFLLRSDHNCLLFPCIKYKYVFSTRRLARSQRLYTLSTRTNDIQHFFSSSILLVFELEEEREKKEKEGRKESKIKLNEIDRRRGYLIPANSHMTTAISHPRKSRASVSSSISAPNACARNTTSPVIDRLAIYPPPIFLSVPAPLPIRFASHRQCLHSDPFDVLLLLLLLPLLVIDRFVADRSSRKEKGEGREILWNGIQRVRGNNSTGSINNSSGNDSRIGSTLAEARK